MNAQSVLALVPSLFDNQRMYLSYSIFVVPVYAGLFIVSLLPGVLSCHDSGVESGLFLLCDGDNALRGSLLVSSEVQELVDEVRILFGLGKSFSRCGSYLLGGDLLHSSSLSNLLVDFLNLLCGFMLSFLSLFVLLLCLFLCLFSFNSELLVGRLGSGLSCYYLSFSSILLGLLNLL